MPSSANLHTGIFAGRCGPVGWFPGHSAGWHIFRCCIACRSCRVQGYCTHCRAVWLRCWGIFSAGRALMQGRTPSSAPVKPCFCCGCALIVAGARVQWVQKSRLAHPGGAVGGFKRAACPTLGPAAADISFCGTFLCAVLCHFCGHLGGHWMAFHEIFRGLFQYSVGCCPCSSTRGPEVCRKTAPDTTPQNHHICFIPFGICFLFCIRNHHEPPFSGADYF